MHEQIGDGRRPSNVVPFSDYHLPSFLATLPPCWLSEGCELPWCAGRGYPGTATCVEAPEGWVRRAVETTGPQPRLRVIE